MNWGLSCSSMPGISFFQVSTWTAVYWFFIVFLSNTPARFPKIISSRAPSVLSSSSQSRSSRNFFLGLSDNLLVNHFAMPLRLQTGFRGLPVRHRLQPENLRLLDGRLPPVAEARIRVEMAQLRGDDRPTVLGQ